MQLSSVNLMWVHSKLEEKYGTPEPREDQNPLETLIATILSQNTSDVNSGRAYHNLKTHHSGWDEMLALPPQELADLIRVGGLANQKSKRIQRLLSWVKQQQDDFDLSWICRSDPYDVIQKFTAIKGIGVKTISIVLCFDCGKDVLPVDTHVNRICRRLGLVDEKSPPERTFWKLDSENPPGKSYTFHLNLIKHGRTLCKARNPECERCPLRERCKYGLTEMGTSK